VEQVLSACIRRCAFNAARVENAFNVDGVA